MLEITGNGICLVTTSCDTVGLVKGRSKHGSQVPIHGPVMAQGLALTCHCYLAPLGTRPGSLSEG